MNPNSADLGPENVLTDVDGELAADVRDRLTTALRYIANWYKATEDSEGAKQVWWSEIDAVRAKVEAAYKAMDPAQLFPGRGALAAYADAQAVFPPLWRKLELSIDTVARPDLVTRAASFVDAVVEMPSIALPAIGDSIARAVGGTLGALFRQLWPWLLGAAALVVAFYAAPILLRRLA
jgi:hypothetical protein